MQVRCKYDFGMQLGRLCIKQWRRRHLDSARENHKVTTTYENLNIFGLPKIGWTIAHAPCPPASYAPINAKATKLI